MSRILREMFLSEIDVSRDPGDQWWEMQEEMGKVLERYPDLLALCDPTIRSHWEEGMIPINEVLSSISAGVFDARDPDKFLKGRGN